jgi:hypothetical protein
VARVRSSRSARRSEDTVEDGTGITPVLVAVRSVDLVIDLVVWIDEDEIDVLLDASGSDAALTVGLSAAESRTGGPLDGSDIEPVAVAYDPHGDRFAKRAVASHGGKP